MGTEEATKTEAAPQEDGRDTQIATLTQKNRILMAQRDLIGQAFLAQTERLYAGSAWRGMMTLAAARKAADADVAKLNAAIEKLSVPQ